MSDYKEEKEEEKSQVVKLSEIKGPIPLYLGV